VFGLQFVDEGHTLVISCSQKRAGEEEGDYLAHLLWRDTRTGKARHALTSAAWGGFMRLKLSPNGLRLACMTNSGFIELRGSTTGRLLTTFDWRRERLHMSGLAFSPDNHTVALNGAFVSAAGDFDGDETRLYDVRTKKTVWRKKDESGSVEAFSPDGKLLLTSDYEGDTRLCDAATGKVRQALAHNGPAAISPDGRHLAASEDAPTTGYASFAALWRLSRP
jgi:WD40 repeat protein